MSGYLRSIRLGVAECFMLEILHLSLSEMKNKCVENLLKLVLATRSALFTTLFKTGNIMPLFVFSLKKRNKM